MILKETFLTEIKDCFGVEAVIAKLTNNLWQCGSFHVQHDCAFLDACPQFKKAVQGQRGHMRFAPALATFFNLLLKLDPPRCKKTNSSSISDSRVNNAVYIQYMLLYFENIIQATVIRITLVNPDSILNVACCLIYS